MLRGRAAALTPRRSLLTRWHAATGTIVTGSLGGLWVVAVVHRNQCGWSEDG
jgi:hypothetical protein